MASFKPSSSSESAESPPGPGPGVTVHWTISGSMIHDLPVLPDKLDSAESVVEYWNAGHPCDIEVRVSRRPEPEPGVIMIMMTRMAAGRAGLATVFN